MKKQKGMAPVTIAAVLIMAAALLLSMFDFSFLAREGKNHIVLPDNDQAPVGVDPNIGPSNLEMLQAVEVDRTNIKRLIEAMQRPEQYHIAASTTLYYADGQSTTAAEGYVSGDWSHTILFDENGAAMRHCLLGSEAVYIWSEGASGWYSGKTGEFTGDDMLYIPTYEDVLQLEDRQILAADYALYGEIYCIMVETVDDNSGYRSLYYISVEDGLLVGAQSFEDENLVYALSAEILPYPENGGEYFKLPDGTAVYE